MTNPKTRKTGKKCTLPEQQQRNAIMPNDIDEHDAAAAATSDEDEQCDMMSTWMQQQAAVSTVEADSSLTPTPSENNDRDEEDNVDGDTDTDSCSSFSLQECIAQFNARRVRRKSTQSRDAVDYVGVGGVGVDRGAGGDANSRVVPADEEDLINQNRSNRAHERKCKPCENGFCYCFTSDSGDGGGGGGVGYAGSGGGGYGDEARGAHVRHSRRHRKSESSQGMQTVTQHPSAATATAARAHFTAASNSHYKSPKKTQKLYSSPNTHNSSQLTAISRLETTSPDAPLVHIIQELRDNCVISEVRVNRHKIQAHQRSHSLSSKPSPKKTHFKVDDTVESRHASSPSKAAAAAYRESLKQPSPSAPALDKLSEIETEECDEGFVYSSPLNSSAKSNDSQRQRHKAAGRLLQKRLSSSRIQFKPRNLNEPPPKPPRGSLGFEDKASVSTLASTTASVRDAERVLDEFLRRRGINMTGADNTSQPTRRNVDKGKDVAPSTTVVTVNKGLPRRDNRKSYPIIQTKDQRTAHKPLPSCPSLSDIEHTIDGKKLSNYEKNLRQISEKPVKEISIGWKEPPDIEEMLNYEASSQPKVFVSQAVQAEPQYHIGWSVPQKIDTVDGGVGRNLASNIEHKHTPIKSRFLSARKTKCPKRHSQKFILSEQLRNLSPWTRKRNNTSMNSCSTRTQPLKSNLRTASRSFLNTSKQKILRLVSPKKSNSESHQFCVCPASKRTVGVQTSPYTDAGTSTAPLYENSSTPQSPPGSYHSAVQTSSSSQMHTVNNTTSDNHQFDFTRTVHSPPRKATRSSHRRLNFPLNCVDGNDCVDGGNDSGTGDIVTKTYRSFHSELDQDVTLSKMGYILGNIRAKLEASDRQAVRTFQETAQRNGNRSFDCPDSFDLHRAQPLRVNRRLAEWEHDPIYSEIEEDSMHIAGSPQHDNKTGVEHFPVQHNPTVLYAKVNKAHKALDSATVQGAPKTPAPPPPPCAKANISRPTPLGKFLHDSLTKRQADKMPNVPLTTAPEMVRKPRISDVSYTSLLAPTDSVAPMHCQSLNNIRVAEHNSPPKRDRNLSKSDLSLQRSDIFLENLCRSELVISAPYLEKVDNSVHVADVSYTSVPDEDDDPTPTSANESLELTNVSVYECSDSNPAGSYLGLDALAASKHTHNQSTPVKQSAAQQHVTVPPRPKSFITKLQHEDSIFLHRPELSIAVSNESLGHRGSIELLNQSCSCPTTPHCLPPLPTEQQKRHAVSLDGVNAHTRKNVKNNDDSNLLNRSRYKRLKSIIRLSFRRGKNFVKTETKRLSTSLNLPAGQCIFAKDERHNQSYSPGSDLDLDALFNPKGNATDELVKAVSICRQLPDLEISAEMVEAERLLLYSTLRREAAKYKLQLVRFQPVRPEGSNRRFFVDGMRLPIKANVNQDLFFNYFYICTFECGGIIKSTQSVECCDGEAIFEDCGIEFTCSGGDVPQMSHEIVDNWDSEVRCQVFMLRLRKVSTLSLEPRRHVVKLSPALLTPSPTSSSSSAGEEIVSRFKLHATFTLRARDFAPYEYVDTVSKQAECMCLRASRHCQTIALKLHSKSSNLAPAMLLTGRAEVRLAKQIQRGYLNVQNPYTLHNWNRRWCTLDGLLLNVWTDENDCAEQPLLSLDMRNNQQTLPLTAAARELCGRPRSFCVQCTVKNRQSDAIDMVLSANGHGNAITGVFFTADSQDELNAWLNELNEVLNFIRKWLC